MQNLIFIIVFVIFNITGQAQSNVKGQVSGYKEGKIKMIGSLGDQNYIADSAIISSDGKFSFTLTDKTKSGLYYFLLPDYKNFQLLFDQEKFIELATTKEKLVQDMRITGSTSNILLYEGLQIQIKIDSVQQKIKSNTLSTTENKAANDLLNVLIELRNQHLKKCFSDFPGEFYTIFKKAGQNPPVREFKKMNGTTDTMAQVADYRARFWDDVPFRDERLLYTPVIGNKLKRYINELTPQVPDSIIRYADVVIKKSMVNDEMFQFVSNWIALQYQPTKSTVMDGEAVYVYIIDKYFNEKTAHWFREGELEQLRKKAGEMKASLLNRKGPDVIAKDPYGVTKSIYEMKAPYIIVYMYNPNCEHCQKETPKLNKFYAEWKSKGVDLFAIVLDTNDDEWKNYIRKNNIEHWTHVFDPTNRAIYGKYYVDITPEMYVLNPERMIIGKNLKTEQLSIIIERDMKKRGKM